MRTKNPTIENKILQEAVKEFSQKGYVGTFLEDIAKKVGISRNPLYYYYGNKAELYIAAANYVMEELKAGYTTIFSANKPISKIIEEDYLYCLKNGWKIFFSSPTKAKDEPDLSKEYHAFNKWLIQMKQVVFQKAKQSGQLKNNCEVSEMITFLYIYYYGVVDTVELAKHSKGFNADMLKNSCQDFMEIIKTRYLK